MSITITGDRDRIFSILDDVGLEPNAIHLSLGIFGKKEFLPSRQIMEICTMCGHGMVSANKVKEILKGSIFAGLKILGWIFKYSLK